MRLTQMSENGEQQTPNSDEEDEDEDEDGPGWDSSVAPKERPVATVGTGEPVTLEDFGGEEPGERNREEEERSATRETTRRKSNSRKRNETRSNEPDNQFPPEESPEEVGNGWRDLLVIIGETIGETDVEDDADRRERPDDARDPPRLMNSGSVSALREEVRESKLSARETRKKRKKGKKGRLTSLFPQYQRAVVQSC